MKIDLDKGFASELPLTRGGSQRPGASERTHLARTDQPSTGPMLAKNRGRAIAILLFAVIAALSAGGILPAASSAKQAPDSFPESFFSMTDPVGMLI